MEYEFHPAADLFPMMTAAELDALGEDMLQHGQREQIILYHGQILDGRNRYRACILKGIEPRFREERPADPYAFVATANLHRRHLSDEQRGMIAARLATMKQGDNQHSPNGETSQARAAELLKVSKRRVERSHEVIEKGVPDLVDAVERRDVKVSAAAEFAKVTPPLDQARLIAEHGSPAAAVKATVKAKADRAAKKMPRRIADPKTAADRAEGRSRQHERKLDVEFEQRVLDECRKRINEMILPSYNKSHAEYQEVIKARKGVMDRATYKKIRSCLHPDRVSDPDLKKRFEDAFHLFTKMELVLLDETQHPTPTVQIPRTYEEMMALKRKVSKARKARRERQSMAR